MIKINRIDCPECLQKPDDQFIEKDCNRSEVKESIYGMQHRKCCYCEKKLISLENALCEIEHYYPKSAFKDKNGNIQWHLANKWENLLLACRSCNSHKGSQLPYNEVTKVSVIINPSCEDIDPEDHIDFIVEDGFFICVKGKNGSLLGQSTIDKLKLGVRRELFANYNREIIEIEKAFMELTIALRGDDNIELNSIKNQLSKIMSGNVQYAAFKRNFIAKRLGKLNEVHIPRLEKQDGKKFEIVDIYFPSGYEIKN